MEREIGETPRQHPARTHDLPECSNRFLRSRRTLSLSLSAIFDPLFLSLSRVHPRIPRHLPAIPLRENQRWLPRQHLNVVPFLVSSSFLSIYIYIYTCVYQGKRDDDAGSARLQDLSTLLDMYEIFPRSFLER